MCELDTNCAHNGAGERYYLKTPEGYSYDQRINTARLTLDSVGANTERYPFPFDIPEHALILAQIEPIDLVGHFVKVTAISLPRTSSGNTKTDRIYPGLKI